MMHSQRTFFICAGLILNLFLFRVTVCRSRAAIRSISLVLVCRSNNYSTQSMKGIHHAFSMLNQEFLKVLSENFQSKEQLLKQLGMYSKKTEICWIDHLLRHRKQLSEIEGFIQQALKMDEANGMIRGVRIDNLYEMRFLVRTWQRQIDSAIKMINT